MQIYDYIRKFKNDHYIYIGDGLISFHTDKESKVINADGKLILELSKEEFCINAKNECYLIANRLNDSFYIINNKRETIFHFEVHNISIMKYRDIFAFYNNESNSVFFLNYTGKKVFEYACDELSNIYEIYQLTSDIVVFELGVNFESRDFNNNLRKNLIINISTNKIIKQGTQKYDEDISIICDAMLFELPKSYEFKRLSDVETVALKVPSIKYTVIEPNYDDDEKVVYQKHVEFCDFHGNIILRTDYSEISEQTDGFYLISKEPHNHKYNTVYGVLDESFQQFLPCVYPKLTIRGKNIRIEQPYWSDTEDSILDLTNKRFIEKNKNGTSILLPYTYSSCDNDIKGIKNNTLLKAYRYDEKGRNCVGIIDKDGNELLPAIYSSLYALSDNLLGAVEYDEYGSIQLIFIDEQSITFRNKYIKVEGRCGDYFRVRVFDKDADAKIRLGIVDKNGNEVVPPIYDYVFFPSDNKINYIKNNIPGWFDLQDGSIHEYPRFSVIRPFKNGIASFSKDPVVIKSLSKYTQQTGYYYDNDCECYGTFYCDDVLGELRIQYRYRYTNHTNGLLDTSGRIILDPIYSEIKREYGLDKLIFVKNSYRWGIVNCSGDLVVPFQYNWYNKDIENFVNEDAAFCCGTENNVDYYDEDAELLESEDIESYKCRGYQNCGYDYDDDYERDTYYALGGDDYDSFRDSGGSIDDMMDGIGL